MTSAFGWLDTDVEQRRRMLEIVDLFREQGILDELGIGSIRDALSGAMFPGTSVLLTRLRYVLFIPWLLEEASHEPTPAEMAARMRHIEHRLTGSLLNGGERTGVIGSTARERLKRLPSEIYWSPLGSWGIKQADLSADAYFRRRNDHRHLLRMTAKADDPEARDILPASGLDPHLPARPNDLLKVASFDLTPKEEQYLSDRIATAVPESMLAWLVHNPPEARVDAVWQIDNLGEAPLDLRTTVDHARRFSISMRGASLLYTLLLARKAGLSQVADLESELVQWKAELDSEGTVSGWDRVAWWRQVRVLNPRVPAPTIAFVNRWLDLAVREADLATSDPAAALVATRERSIKGLRARLHNQAALDRWSGDTRVGYLDYRWSVTQRLLGDLYAARGHR